MATILVDDAEARLISESPVVEVRDSSGNLVGLITRDLLEDIEIARERMKRPMKGKTLEEALAWIESQGDGQ